MQFIYYINYNFDLGCRVAKILTPGPMPKLSCPDTHLRWWGLQTPTYVWGGIYWSVGYNYLGFPLQANLAKSCWMLR